MGFSILIILLLPYSRMKVLGGFAAGPQTAGGDEAPLFSCHEQERGQRSSFGAQKALFGAGAIRDGWGLAVWRSRGSQQAAGFPCRALAADTAPKIVWGWKSS